MPTCIADNCSKPALARQVCSGHYYRLRKYGDPNFLPPKIQRICSFEGCDNPYWSGGYCTVHYVRQRRHGDPSIVIPKGEWNKKNQKGVPARAEVGYLGAHNRVYSLRGKASQYLCECGKPAQEWAYTHSGIQERLARPNKNGFQFKYSLDPDQYVPMCKPCHNEFDRSRSDCT